MTYVRAVPAADIGDIVTAPNDLEQEELFLPVDALVADVLPWIGYDKRADAPDEDGSFPARMLHFALNRPVGALRGESDLPDSALVAPSWGLAGRSGAVESFSAGVFVCGTQGFLRVRVNDWPDRRNSI